MDTERLVPIDEVLTSLFEVDDPEAEARRYERKHVATLSRLFGALLAGDYTKNSGENTEDAEIELVGPTDFPFIRKAKGPAAIAEMVQHNFGTLTDQVPALTSLTAQGDQITLWGTERGRIRATGQFYDLHFVYLFTMRDGKVARVLQLGSYRNPEQPG